MVRVVAVAQDDERANRLAGGVVGNPDHRGLGDPGVTDERRLHLGGGDPVPGHIHHVVDATQHPDRPVGIETGAIPGEVKAFVGEFGPVGVPVPLGVTPNATQH